MKNTNENKNVRTKICNFVNDPVVKMEAKKAAANAVTTFAVSYTLTLISSVITSVIVKSINTDTKKTN